MTPDREALFREILAGGVRLNREQALETLDAVAALRSELAAESHDRDGTAERLGEVIFQLTRTIGRTRKALAALVTEVAGSCGVCPATGKLACDEAGEPVCGEPARWGILTAWSCDEHRRQEDRTAIGGPALQAAFALLAERW